jgi:hypothetical protein
MITVNYREDFSDKESQMGLDRHKGVFFREMGGIQYRIQKGRWDGPIYNDPEGVKSTSCKDNIGLSLYSIVHGSQVLGLLCPIAYS